MSVSFKKDHGYFESSNGTSRIHYCIWTPDSPPRAIVQIVHGMCEYIERYDTFARFLVSKGIVVCGHDHIGHGKSVESEDDLGFFAPSDGDVCIVSDVEKMRLIMRERYRQLPYFLLGHSFGSFVVRTYAFAYPADSVDAVILSGTCGDELPSGAGRILASIIAALRGKRHRSKLLFKLAFGGYNKRFKSEIESSKGFAWVTTDPQELERYVSDSLCTFRFTAQAYRDMFMIISHNKKNLPHRSLPIYLFAGTEDPVGNYGQGVAQLYQTYFEAEISDVTFKLYENERHEVLTGLKKEEAFEDLYIWIDRVANDKVELMRQNMISF
ncbi:MAG: lysophospholipase [Clostridia bacterium]|nr:lysophospholipase [Clostridia bacterium]MBQ8743527.1 lysophospholipase [Clostridia bacterium]